MNAPFVIVSTDNKFESFDSIGARSKSLLHSSRAVPLFRQVGKIRTSIASLVRFKLENETDGRHVSSRAKAGSIESRAFTSCGGFISSPSQPEV